MDNGLLRETDKRIGADALAGEENCTDIRNERIGSAPSEYPCEEGAVSGGWEAVVSGLLREADTCPTHRCG